MKSDLDSEEGEPSPSLGDIRTHETDCRHWMSFDASNRPRHVGDQVMGLPRVGGDI